MVFVLDKLGENSLDLQNYRYRTWSAPLKNIPLRWCALHRRQLACVFSSLALGIARIACTSPILISHTARLIQPPILVIPI